MFHETLLCLFITIDASISVPMDATVTEGTNTVEVCATVDNSVTLAKELTVSLMIVSSTGKVELIVAKSSLMVSPFLVLQLQQEAISLSLPPLTVSHLAQVMTRAFA